MFLSRIQLFVITKLLNIVLPILVLLGFFLYPSPNLIDNILYTLFVGNFIFLIYKTSPWEFSNYYIRYTWLIIYLIISLRNIFIVGGALDDVRFYSDIIVAILSVIMMHFNIMAVFACKKPKSCMRLSFPFKDGKFIITDGGDGRISSLINYHNKAHIHKYAKTNSSMRYATDITKLSKSGFSVKSVLTKENKNYEIYNEKVYAPCNAIVYDTVDGIKNNEPFSKDFPYNVGNRIILARGDYYIILGHLQKNSILVKAGDIVKENQELALIGNSGLTPRPHLHMQVSKSIDGDYWSGKGVPIIFDNKHYPSKNKLIKK